MAILSKKDITDFPIEVIKWNDACFGESARKLDDPVGLVPLIDVGFRLHEDDESITLALEISPSEGKSRYQVCIPKGCVIGRKVIKREA